MTSLRDIRAAFLSFFADRGHAIAPSAPLIPQNDPTLLFVNAGMVPFKNVFTGSERAKAPRATTAQKCVRAGGKHNDLDNVGYTARHHTFFEMLGNFSFGDYFKADAVEFAWSLVHGEFALPKDRLVVTIYHDDDEAFDLWRKISGLPEDRIVRIATDDNFWSMGDTGPCGPSSEIFYDHGPEIPGGPPGSPDEDGDRFVEIWNLVFMQFDRQADGTQAPLPKPSIDTGMGLERIAAVLQGVHDNYDVDLFKRLIAASEEATGRPASGADAAAHRVVADHLRASCFLIADGVTPANEGRGYVLRRIMRRAMRYARQLGARDPLLARLAPVLISEMGEAYGELRRAEALIVQTLSGEEDRFRSLLERGLKLLEDDVAATPAGAPRSGEAAFRLYDTYGFPLDLTEDALRRMGREADVAGCDAAMARQREAARAAWAGSGDAASDAVWRDVADAAGATEFLGYVHDTAEGVIQAIVVDGASVDAVEAGARAEIVVNQTPFYAEAGGQVGDAGEIRGADGFSMRVDDVKKRAGAASAHIGEVLAGAARIGDVVELRIDAPRRAAIRANHSATHLLHKALRDALGPHVAQKGSLVAPDRLRFDFSHPKPLSTDEIVRIERDVNALVRANRAVDTRLMSYDDAVEAGAVALFGEKYGEEVRVLTMGAAADAPDASGKDLGGEPPRDEDAPYSVELCGGTHVARLGDIALFKIVAEGAAAAGVRRIEALTGEAARAYLEGEAAAAAAAAAALKTTTGDLPERVEALVGERKRLERELAEMTKKIALGVGGSASADAATKKIGAVTFSGRRLDGVAAKDLRSLVDQEKARLGDGVVALVSVLDGKAALTVGVAGDAQKRVSAVDLVRVGAEALGGKGGGGRPDLAQAGGPNGADADRALAAIEAEVETSVGA
ncbi:MAG: alanine--tRNA ligase [Parvularculaceae bacterium]